MSWSGWVSARFGGHSGSASARGIGVLRGHRRQGPQDRGAQEVPRARGREAGEGPEVRRQGDQPRRRGVQGAQPASGRPVGAGRDHCPYPRPRHPGRGRRRGPVRGARPGLGEARRAAAQVSRPSARAQGRQRPHPDQCRGGHRRAREPARDGEGREQHQRSRPQDQDGIPGGGGRRPAGRPREDAPRRADGAGPGALRDGAGRPRLLPLRGEGQRPAERGLPPARLPLRCHPPEGRRKCRRR